ncbi:uncharacterized protein MELLADRAFT_72732 [Melampsora larici-populina 98AG31]|uniref:Zn(2)-C6 fungal-type domain-containing protein n=1 Tax=Melampsora larici-populina (strain 98AG31 / pathotype 3-4-7) TaxID=747676 RepID=F4RY50_MELLP|nr:uncharacterized protein MELLADRAFT_72732 [Melampsora larici-populina 98AG31]EGG02619.1 hypothetical protein MELLADRAFT_72732 [Melampsora larici-populina 98AG31]
MADSRTNSNYYSKNSLRLMMAKKFRAPDDYHSTNSFNHHHPSIQSPGSIHPTQSTSALPTLPAFESTERQEDLAHWMLYEPKCDGNGSIIPPWARRDTQPNDTDRRCEVSIDRNEPSTSSHTSTFSHLLPLPSLISSEAVKKPKGAPTLPGIAAMLAGASASQPQLEPLHQNHGFPPQNPLPPTRPPKSKNRTGLHQTEPRTRQPARHRRPVPTPSSSQQLTTTTPSGSIPITLLQSTRQRVSIACTFCRTRKLRCTPGPGPCEHCSRRGNECVFDVPGRL